jgi:hypothetical protein
MTMSNQQSEIFSFVVLVILLFVGGIVAGFFLPYVPVTEGWQKGIVMGMIQIVILAVFGFLIKFSLWNVLIGGFILMIGAVLGGYIVDLVGVTDVIATFLTLTVQALMLMALGLVRSHKTAKIVKA